MLQKIHNMIERNRLKVFFSRWRTVCKRRQMDESADYPDHLKRALQYFSNWKSFRVQSQGLDDLQFKSTVFTTWRGLFKEHQLSLHLHSVKLLPFNHRANFVLVKAFEVWREGADYKRRQREEDIRVKEQHLHFWKSCHLRIKVRTRAANLFQKMSKLRGTFKSWRLLCDKKSRLDKLGLVAWYQKMVGDTFIHWRKLTRERTRLHTIFKNWRLSVQTVKKSLEMANQYHQHQQKRHHFDILISRSKQRLSTQAKANALLEGRLRAMRREKFSNWRLLTDETCRQLQVARLLYARQQQRKVLKAWSQTSAYQKAADEHLRGNMLVKGLYFWRAAVKSKVDNRELKLNSLKRWLFMSKTRRSTRFFYGQVMLKSVSKYGPSTKSLSILLPSPELSASRALSRSVFDETRNKARCLFLWLHKWRRSNSLRQAAIDYRKMRFGKMLHKWRSLQLLRNGARNEPYNLRSVMFKRWMQRARVSSTTVSKIDKKLQVLFEFILLP